MRPAAVRKKLTLWHGFRGESLKEFVSWVTRVSYSLFCPPQVPGLVQILKRLKIAVDHSLGREDDILQFILVLASCSSIPNGYGGGKDGFNNSSVKVFLHCLWQIELQLLQKEHPLLCFLCEKADIHLPLKVLSYCRLLLKSKAIPTEF